MTRLIVVRNVEEALSEGFWWLKTAGVREHSRAGPVVVAPGPVVTEYLCPQERIVFNAERDANPTFHLLEALWMLAGADDVKFLLSYNKRMQEYAETNGQIHGAYGYRWRKMFGFDQVLEVIKELRTTPSSRQAVIQMWAAAADLNVTKRDRPCNTHIYFDCRENVLNMTVCCRSNDALWGAYGANAVHFSILQELIALGVGVPVGVYRQFSNNFHAYTDVPLVAKWLDQPPAFENGRRYPPIVPLLQPDEGVDDFLMDCANLVRGQPAELTHFFRYVVGPLKHAYDARKVGGRTWRQMAQAMADCDWKVAFLEWAERREHVSE